MKDIAGMIQPITKTFVIAHEGDDDPHLAQALVFNAARLAWRMREIGVTTHHKTSLSDVVTEADTYTEQFVVEALAALRPQDGILGEEGSTQTSSSGRVWVIDPVDGTYNFTLGSDYWCSALALVEGNPETAKNPEELCAAGTVRFGAVHRPAMGYTWCGGPENPTSRDGRELLRLEHTPAEKLCLGTYLHPTFLGDHAVRDPWEKVASRFASWRMLGAGSVDLASVADGTLGAWLQHSVPPWDWLPGKALVEGAGGETLQIETGGVVWSVAGNPRAVQEIAECLG